MRTLSRSPLVRVLEFWFLGVLPLFMVAVTAIIAIAAHTLAYDFDRAYAPAIHHVLHGAVAVRAVDLLPPWARRPRSSIRRSAPFSERLWQCFSAQTAEHPRHVAGDARRAGDPLAGRGARLALHRSGAAVDADGLGDPPRHRQHPDGARRRADVAVAGSSSPGRRRPRARDRAQALPLAARHLARDHQALPGRDGGGRFVDRLRASSPWIPIKGAGLLGLSAPAERAHVARGEERVLAGRPARTPRSRLERRRDLRLRDRESSLLVWAYRRRDAESSAFGLVCASRSCLTPILWPNYLVIMLAPLGMLRPRFGLVWLLPDAPGGVRRPSTRRCGRSPSSSPPSPLWRGDGRHAHPAAGGIRSLMLA